MKKKYIIGNWKSNKSQKEVEEWFTIISEKFKGFDSSKLANLEIVVCPIFIHLPLAKKLRDDLQIPIKLGAQDVSPYEKGAYTGEIGASQLAEFVDYVIVGHSERRENFHEDSDLLIKKTEQAKIANLKTIFCVQDEKTQIPKDVFIVAYEPVWAIGSGNPDTPENASQLASILKSKSAIERVIYGGSIKPENVQSFLAAKDIDGVLPGGASLDPNSFWGIITNATNIEAIDLQTKAIQTFPWY